MRRRILFFCGIAVLAVYPAARIAALKSQLRSAEERLGKTRSDTAPMGGSLAEKPAEISSLKNQIRELEARLTQSQTELKKLRAAMLRKDSALQSHQGTSTTGSQSVGQSSFATNLMALAERAIRIDKHFKGFPHLEIPEIGILSESNWIEIASENSDLETAEQIQKALHSVIKRAKTETALEIAAAYRRAGDLAEIQSMEQLAPHLKEGLTPEMAARYELVPSSKLEPKYLQHPLFQDFGGAKTHLEAVVREKHPVGGTRQFVTLHIDEGAEEVDQNGIKTTTKTTAQFHFQIPPEQSP